MFAAVYNALAMLVSIVRFMEIGLRMCMWLVLGSMAVLGRVMGVGEARIIRDLCLLEYMGIGVIVLLGAHYGAATTCAMGHLLQAPKKGIPHKNLVTGKWESKPETSSVHERYHRKRYTEEMPWNGT